MKYHMNHPRKFDMGKHTTIAPGIFIGCLFNLYLYTVYTPDCGNSEFSAKKELPSMLMSGEDDGGTVGGCLEEVSC